MVDPKIVRARLEHLEESLKRLAWVRNRGREAFLSGWELRDIAERNLQTAIQAVLDLGNHLISDAGLRTPERYTEIPRGLHAAGIIDEELAERLVPITGMRNILVHEYTQIEAPKVWAAIEEVTPLEDFAAKVASVLEKIS